jgi:hypothetical protein
MINGLCDKIFLLGAKGRYFDSSCLRPGIQLGQLSDNQFELIYKMIQYTLKRSYEGTQNEYMQKFLKREHAIVNYFRDSGNQKAFFKQISGLPAKAKIAVRDYYLWLLHNIDKSEYYSQSFLLSTTTDMRRAEYFAGFKKNFHNSNAVVFVGWLPKKFKGVLRAPTTREINDLLKEPVNLPRYKDLIFYNQNEIALKGGLFPHFTLGFYYWYKRQIFMEINPAIFDVGEQWNGHELPIKYEYFDNAFNETIYNRFFSLDVKTGFYNEHYRTDNYNWEFNMVC